MAQQILSTNTFCEAKFVVDTDASQGGYTTIAAALTAATSGSTVFIRPGTYTENLTLKAGVNLTAFGSDSSLNATGAVIISGTCTLTTAGTVTISGIQLQTNAAALLAVTGTLASVVNLNNCYLNCGTSAITYSSSSASSAININNCKGNISTTGIAAFSHSSAGVLTMKYCSITNTGLSTTAATASAGTFDCEYNYLEFTVTSSSTNSFIIRNNHFNTAGINTVCCTIGGSGTNTANASVFSSGSASSLSIGGTLTIIGCQILSANTNCITGAGTIIYSGLSFSSSALINVTTQTASGTVQGGQFQAPSAGFLGEQIRSAVAQASAVTLASNTVSNVTSISLTAGIWDVSGIVTYGNSATGTGFASSITSTTAGLGTSGDNAIAGTASPNATQDMGYSIPSYRFTLSATTTIFLTAFATVTVGTMKAFGRISATRVG